MASTVQSIDTQHSDMVHDAQLDFYGKRLATCSSDRSIRVFDSSSEQPKLEARIACHTAPVWECSWAHPKFGTLLASCSYDKTARIHREVEQGQWSTIFVNSEHKASVNSIAWAPQEHGCMLACASSDGDVSVVSGSESGWTVTSFHVCSAGTNAVTWAPFAHIGAQQGGGKPVMRLCVACNDGTVRIFRFNGSEGGWAPDAVLGGGEASRAAAAAGGEAAAAAAAAAAEEEQPRHENWVRDVAWSPAAGMPANVVASCSDDRKVIIWTQLSGSEQWRGVELPRFEEPVWRLSWSLTGHLLAVSSGDATVSLWTQTMSGAWQQVTEEAAQAVEAEAEAGAAAGSAAGATGLVA